MRAGKVYLSATEQALKAGKRAPICKKSKNVGNVETTVIIGGGAGGLAAAESLRSV